MKVERANALWNQQRRCDEAREAVSQLALRRLACAERRRCAEAVGVARSAELVEAREGHPERLAAVADQVSDLAAALGEVEREAIAAAELYGQHKEQRRVNLKELAELQQHLCALQAQQDSRGRGGREAHERLRAAEAAEAAARGELECHARRLAQNVLLLRRLHNECLSLKGNVRVFCRLRPQSEMEEQVRVELREDSQGITVFSRPQRNVTGMTEQTNSWDFTFDHVFGPEAKQADVFEEIALLVQSALDGYRVAIFAYGQTGSGKTHTMEGPPAATGTARGEEDGMIPRTVDLIFEEVRQLQQNGWVFEVQTSMAEVYNEVVYDLLRENAAGTETRSIPVADASAVHSLLKRAARERHVAATAANHRSSRSHAVFQLSLLGRCQVKGQERTVEGLLSFVDLAGSERVEKSGAAGERLKEAQHINRSLSALGDVIEAVGRRSALAERQRRRGGCQEAVPLHVPYRNSRLTMLLRESLGGDSKTLMFVNISQAEANLGETVSSLRFAAKVHACNVGVARRHCDAEGDA